MDCLFETKKNNKTEKSSTFHDISIVNEVDTRVNFIIKCEDETELKVLQKHFNTKAKRVEFERIKWIVV